MNHRVAASYLRRRVVAATWVLIAFLHLHIPARASDTLFSLRQVSSLNIASASSNTVDTMLLPAQSGDHQITGGIILVSTIVIAILAGIALTFRRLNRLLQAEINERKTVEETLTAERSHLQTIFEHNGAGHLIVSSTRQILQVNQQFCNMFGYTKEELIGQSAEIIHLDRQHYEEWAPRFKDARDNITHLSAEYPWRRKDGSIFWCSFTGVQLLLPNGEKGVVWSVIDISEHVQLVRRREADQRFLQTILDAIPDLIFIKDRNSVYLGCNDAFASRYTGHTKEEIIGHSDIDVVPDRERVEKYVASDRDVMATGKNMHLELQVTMANGSKALVEVLKTPFYDTSGEIAGVIGVARDITEQRMMQAELLRSQKLESLGVLAGGIAHDFNNILTAIMGNISFAKLDTDPSFSAYASLERAEKACQRAAELAKQLLVFAKGGQPIKRIFSLEHLIKDTVALTLSGTNVQGVIDFPEPLYAVEADEGQISQSLHNIIINAVQAMPGGGKLVVHGENVSQENADDFGLPAGSYILISLKDEGCGISEADQKKIFDPYFTTKAEGTGLGLASAYSCIAKHGGRIVVDSSIGHGATFTIFLPSLEVAIAQPGVAEEAALGCHGNCSILVMDDDEMIRELATITLSRFGYKVTTCADGENAIMLYSSAQGQGTPFDLVIMDLTIPGGMGGLETARRLLAIDPKARLIVSSGYSDDPVMANYAEYGFCAAIEKPYRVKDIAAVLAGLH